MKLKQTFGFTKVLHMAAYITKFKKLAETSVLIADILILFLVHSDVILADQISCNLDA